MANQIKHFTSKLHTLQNRDDQFSFFSSLSTYILTWLLLFSLRGVNALFSVFHIFRARQN